MFQLIQKNPNFASIIFPEKTSTKNKVWDYTDMIIGFMGWKVEWQKTVLIFANYFSPLTWNILSKKSSTLNDFKNAKKFVYRAYFAKRGRQNRAGVITVNQNMTSLNSTVLIFTVQDQSKPSRQSKVKDNFWIIYCDNFH